MSFGWWPFAWAHRRTSCGGGGGGGADADTVPVGDVDRIGIRRFADGLRQS